MSQLTSGTRERTSLLLCLSGGGFRATFFHLGVLRFLNDMATEDGRRRLDDVAAVFSVSGGSILAAHLAVHWDAYKRDFDSAAESLVRFGRSDVLWRLLLPPIRSLTQRFEDLLHKELFARQTLGQLNLGEDGPRFFILATDLTTGESFWFGDQRFVVVELDGHNELEIRARQTFRLARAVAASCALPPFLRPVLINGERDLDPSSESEEHKILLRRRWLADGGVYDNIGVSAARVFKRRAISPTPRIVVSDASSRFATKPNRS